MKGYLIYLKCQVCGAEEDKPCRTPKGKKKEYVHEFRKMEIVIKGLNDGLFN